MNVGSGIGSNQTPFVGDGSGSGSAIVENDASGSGSDPVVVVVDDGSGSCLDLVVDESSTENDESIEVEKEPEEAEARVHDAGSLPHEHDPGLRQLISSFDVNERDAARRGYILKGTCQPHAHEYPITTIYSKDRCFSLL